MPHRSWPVSSLPPSLIPSPQPQTAQQAAPHRSHRGRHHPLPDQRHGRDLRGQGQAVTEYPDFEALLDDEGPSNINPTATRELRLANIRAIYPSEKEALGALAIEIALLDSAP